MTRPARASAPRRPSALGPIVWKIVKTALIIAAVAAIPLGLGLVSTAMSFGGPMFIAGLFEMMAGLTVAIGIFGAVASAFMKVVIREGVKSGQIRAARRQAALAGREAPEQPWTPGPALPASPATLANQPTFSQSIDGAIHRQGRGATVGTVSPRAELSIT